MKESPYHWQTTSWYFRLVFMAILECCATVPMAVVNIYLTYNHKDNIYRYKGFGDLHLRFDRVDQYPLAIWLQFPSLVGDFVHRDATWTGCALAYFLIFGFTQDARKHYATAITFVLRALHLKPCPDHAFITVV